MRAAYAAAETMLRQAAGRLGLDCPGPVPLRLDRGQGTIRSALAKKLAGGADPEPLARSLAQVTALCAPFSRVGAERGILILTLSEPWLRAVLARFSAPAESERPPCTAVRRCDREDAAFLLDYTARRCAALARRPGETEILPPALICLLAEPEPDPVQTARAYWNLPPRVRQQPELAGAVAAVLQFIHRNPDIKR